VTTSGAGALPGGGIAMSTDGNSRLTVSAAGGQGQGATPSNTKTNPSDHTKLGPSKKAMNFLKGWEKWHDHPYNPDGGIPNTIGWGHTMSKADIKAYEDLKNMIDSSPFMQVLGLGKAIADAAFTLTPKQGAALLQQDVASVESRLKRVFGVKTLRGLKQNQYDALFDLGYNAGIKSNWNLVKDINAGKYNAAATEFLNIDKSHGQVMRGLYKRRRKEAMMFLYGLNP